MLCLCGTDFRPPAAMRAGLFRVREADPRAPAHHHPNPALAHSNRPTTWAVKIMTKTKLNVRSFFSDRTSASKNPTRR